MKTWTITTVVETENEWKVSSLRKRLDYFVNRGAGMYMEVRPKVAKIKMIKKDDL